MKSIVYYCIICIAFISMQGCVSKSNHSNRDSVNNYLRSPYMQNTIRRDLRNQIRVLEMQGY